MTLPTTCPDFVSHPHLIEGRNCYTCVASLCSEEQGTSAIAEALIAIGIPADVPTEWGSLTHLFLLSLALADPEQSAKG